MNVSNQKFAKPTRSGPSARATWLFIFAAIPVLLVGCGYVAGWVYGLVVR